MSSQCYTLRQGLSSQLAFRTVCLCLWRLKPQAGLDAAHLAFTLDAGNPDLAPILVQQALYPLTHLLQAFVVSRVMHWNRGGGRLVTARAGLPVTLGLQSTEGWRQNEPEAK